MTALQRPKSYPHLPSGRQPGPQTLRSGGPRRRFASYTLGAAMGWGVLWWILSPASGVTQYAIGAGGLAVAIGGGGLVQRRAAAAASASHLNLSVSDDEPRRGDELVATVRVSDPAKAAERIEVGLVCRELYDYRTRSSSSSSVGSSSHSRRVTGEKTCFEQWQPIERTTGDHLTFRIPPEQPFSYEGDCLSFSWKVTVREPVEGGIDRTVDHPIWVLP